jgi:hypothetical protein
VPRTGWAGCCASAVAHPAATSTAAAVMRENSGTRRKLSFMAHSGFAVRTP